MKASVLSPPLLLLASLLNGGARAQENEAAAVTPLWRGETVQDLHREYGNVFRHGNRNAASHRWATFLLERAPQMGAEKLAYMFSGFCAVSGSPVRPNDYGRYMLRLESVVAQAPAQAGFMYYCCWPCVCDTQDFIKVDTKTVTTSDGPKQYRFAVIGNPCDRPEKLKETFIQPFGFRETTLEREAPEVRCTADGSLEGATMSDHGFVIISMFFDGTLSEEERDLLPGGLPAIGGGGGEDKAEEESAEAAEAASSSAVVATTDSAAVTPPPAFILAGRKSSDMQPGRISDAHGLAYQDEVEYGGMCEDRAQNGYNSGMGEIFRRVAQISPIVPIAV